MNADTRYLVFGERIEKVFVHSSIMKQENMQVNHNHSFHITSNNLKKILQMKALPALQICVYLRSSAVKISR
jgi:hypothetical protein